MALASTLSNKVVIVTGGGSGIGEASCYAFAQAGAAVVIVSRTLAKADTVAQAIRAIRADQGTAVALQGDVSRNADVQRVIAQTMDRFGRVDVLFNNAGISPAGRV